jgi:hypothetical protein
MGGHMSENVNDDKIKIEFPRSHAKKLGETARGLYRLIADILDSHGITGSNRLDYFHFAEKILKIITHKNIPLWAKAIEAEKSSYVILRNLNKDVLNDIEKFLLDIFKDAYEKYGYIDFDTALQVIQIELTKREYKKITGINME